MPHTGPSDASRTDALVAERRRIRRLFNRAAGVLSVFDGHLRREYARTLDRVALGAGLDVLDLGTGTGNLAAALHARGHRVVGIDFAELLREVALAVAEHGETSKTGAYWLARPIHDDLRISVTHAR